MINSPFAEGEFSHLISSFERFCIHFESRTVILKGQKFKISENEFQADAITPKTLVHLLEKSTSFARQKSGAVFTPDSITYEIVTLALNSKIWSHFAKNKSNATSSSRYVCFWDFLSQWVLNRNPIQISDYLSELFDQILSHLSILDPAVGGGEFIFTAFLKMLEFYILLFPWKELQEVSSKKKKHFLVLLNNWNQVRSSSTTEIRIDFLLQTCNGLELSLRADIYDHLATIINHNLFYCDIDPSALQITRIRLICVLKVLFGDLMQDGSLISPHAYPMDFLSNTLNKIPDHFDIIVGNPPYVGSDALAKYHDPGHHKELKKKFAVVVQPGSKPDLYFYFLKRSIDLLADQGILGFILPNRILSNTYAMQVRQYLFSSTQLDFIITFADTIPIFSSANIHPCIMLLSKPSSNSVDECYRVKHFSSKTLSKSPSWDIVNHFTIHFSLAQAYNIILTNLSLEDQQYLEMLSHFPPLKTVLQIHEGTRIARFQSKFPPHFPFRISREEWCLLTDPEKTQYLAEIRGKHIKSYFILPSPSYLALPKLLLSTSSSSHRLEYLQKFSVPTLFIRELGERIFASYLDCQQQPSIGYGGVYYFDSADFTEKFFQREQVIGIPHSDLLLAFLVYFSSNFFLYIYRKLFTTGSWGNALKFRSSYFAQIPFVSFNYSLFSLFGKIQTVLHGHDLEISQENQDQHVKFINWIQYLSDLLLIGRMYSDKIPSLLGFEQYLMTKFDSLDLTVYSDVTSDFLDQLLQFLQPFYLQVTNHPVFKLLVCELDRSGIQLSES